MRTLTPEEKQYLYKIRAILDKYYPFILTDTAAINDAVEGMRDWTPASYSVNDVVKYNGIPYKCVQAHDSTNNSEWTPSSTPALWMEYHGTSKETARNWIAPTGAHDMYKQGEWMIFTDGKYYECLNDTAYSPTDYSSAWRADGVEPKPEPSVPEFVQPTGAHDAYKKGDKVSFNGKIYESLIDANVYSPSAYPLGWQEVDG